MEKTAIEKLAAHVNELAARYGLTVHYFDMNWREGRSNWLRGIIEIAQIDSEAAYAAALHELGHQLYDGVQDLHTPYFASVQFQRRGSWASGGRVPVEDLELIIKDEERAWGWAQEHALAWTPAMQATKDWALGTYYHDRSRVLVLTPEQRATYEAGRQAWIDEMPDEMRQLIAAVAQKKAA